MPIGKSTPTVDAVGKPLTAVMAELAEQNQNYVVDYTYPPRRTFPLMEDDLYVLRQHADDAGILHLIAGEKMGKEA